MAKEYIEREAVLNDIAELFTLCHETSPNECGHHFVTEEELETHWDFVKSIPAADVRPVVRGHWVKKNDGICYWHECSECGERMPLSIYGVDYYSHYCPNCGAQMDADMRGDG